MSRSLLTPVERTVDERTTQKYTATIKDENGAAIPSGSLTTLTLTLYDVDSQMIINSRNNQNVLNLNDVTVDAAGLLTWTMQPADNAILSVSLSDDATERHMALFKFTFGAGGSKAGSHELGLLVRNVGKVT